MVVDSYHIFIVVIVAALAEGFGDGELVADTHVHQTVNAVAIQEFDHGLFQNIEIGHGLIQGVACVKDLPGDHVGEVGDPLRFLEIGSVTEKLHPCLL